MFGPDLPGRHEDPAAGRSTAQSPSFTIDLADFEIVGGPIGKPANAIDVVADFGADPSGGAADNTAKFQAAVNAGTAQGRPGLHPAGQVHGLDDHIIVDSVTLRGAGPWYTVLGGRHPTQRNRPSASTASTSTAQGGPVAATSNAAQDFAIIGDIREREDNDQVNAIGGAMTNSVIDNVWMQHTKVGAWMDGPMDNFTIRNSRDPRPDRRRRELPHRRHQLHGDQHVRAQHR